MSGSGKHGEIDCTWQGSLHIYNPTSHDAIDVQVHWPSVERRLPLEKLRPPHVKGMETRTLALNVKQGFPKDQVVQCHDRFEELFPPELRNFSIVFSYKNDRGNSFYTKYAKADGHETTSQHFFKPKTE